MRYWGYFVEGVKKPFKKGVYRLEGGGAGSIFKLVKLTWSGGLGVFLGSAISLLVKAQVNAFVKSMGKLEREGMISLFE